jgi:hypothetical protein
MIPPWRLPAMHEESTMSSARYFVVQDRDSWLIKFDDEEYGPYRTQAEAVHFAIDAAQKLGEYGQAAQVCVMGDNGRFRSEWSSAQPPVPRA